MIRGAGAALARAARYAARYGFTLERTTAEAAKHAAAHPHLIATSSETGFGISELRTAILEAATS